MFLVLEYCPGGELYSRMKSANRMCEAEAKFYFAELVVALRDLQEQVQPACPQPVVILDCVTNPSLSLRGLCAGRPSIMLYIET